MKQLSQAYGYDDVSIVPSEDQVDPADVDTSVRIGSHTIEMPVLSSAMDAATGVSSAIVMGRLGGLGVLNLEGLHTRYENPDEVIGQILEADQKEVIRLIQQLYREPIKEHLVALRIREIKAGGVLAAVSALPATAPRLVRIAEEAGCDIFCIQSTITTAKYYSTRSEYTDLSSFCGNTQMPVILGNCVTYQGALDLMRCGAAAILVGVGPGNACTSRRVLGIGVPQITAIMDAAAAREQYLQETGRYVTVVADGGMRVGGDVAKSIAAGADAVMIGTPIASSVEAPGRGFNWGMATQNSDLPRGTRVQTGVLGTLQEILLGPTSKDDGTMNLVGALRLSMACCGARTIREMQQARLVIAPAVNVEGKALQVKAR
jgi:IMP dehydrogenase